MSESKGRRWALGLAVLAVLSAGAGAVVLRHPAYEWWQVHRLRTDGWPAAQSAAEWLSEKGSPASLPALIDLFETPSGAGNRALVWESLARHQTKCLSVLGRYLRERQGRAPCMLSELLPLSDELPWVKTPALFVEALASKEECVRLWGAASLGRLGPEGGAGALALRSALEDPAPTVRARAVQALLEIGSQDARIVPALLQSLAEGTMEMHEAIAGVAVGARTEPLVLDELLWRTEPSARELALKALWKLDGPAATRVPSLPRLLADPDPEVSVSAALLLIRADFELEAVAPCILRALDDPYGSWWGRALTALPRLGAAARPGVAALVRALKTDYGKAPLDAADALGCLGAVASEAAPALIEALESTDIWTRRCAARALPEVAIDAGPAIAALEARLLDPAAEVRVRAAVSLILLESARRDALLPILESALKSEVFYIRREAALAFVRVGHTGGEISRLLVELGLHDEDLLPIAAQAVRSGNLPDLAPLRSALRSEIEDERLRAASFLAALGPSAREASAELIHALGDDSAAVQAAAMEALENIRADPAEAIPTLEEAASDISLEIRLDAREALDEPRPRH